MRSSAADRGSRLLAAALAERRVLVVCGSGGVGKTTTAAALAAARRHLRRRKMTQFYEARLRRALPLPMVSLPYLFDEEVGPSSIERLARHLEAA